MSHTAVKALIKQVCEGGGSLPAQDCGKVYTRQLFLRDIASIERYFDDEDRDGIKRAVTFILRAASNESSSDDLAYGGTVAKGYIDTYEVQILRGYHFEDYDSAAEVEDVYETLRAAFDTQAVRDLFFNAGYAVSSLSAPEISTVNYNGLGVLMSSVKAQLQVWTP